MTKLSADTAGVAPLLAIDAPAVICRDLFGGVRNKTMRHQEIYKAAAEESTKTMGRLQIPKWLHRLERRAFNPGPLVFTGGAKTNASRRECMKARMLWVTRIQNSVWDENRHR
jgi:hypothetical protein